MLKLYSYFRSSAAYRVRIALHLKNINYELIPIHLVRDGGQQFSAAYQAINPQKIIPALVDGETIITQSLAILEYLEELYPQPALWPQAPATRAQARAFALNIACEIHPLNNLKVLKFITGNLKCSEEQKLEWYAHWIAEGFDALEKRLTNNPLCGNCCFGDTPTIADIFLIPQMANAKRFNCPLDNYPILRRIDEYCLSLPAFEKARPENQPDAE